MDSREKEIRKTRAEVGGAIKAADRLFMRGVPLHGRMVQAMADSLPFRKASALRIIDFGCGSGILAEKILSRYPRSRFTGVDVSEDMLKMASVKLFSYRGAYYFLGDLREFPYKGWYELIVSSLTLHSLAKDDKLEFYRRLFKSLARKGMFYTLDRFTPYNTVSNGHVLSLTEELEIMRKAGMRGIEVMWRDNEYAVCRAVKGR